jgi:putative acetyltransferase
MTDVTTRTEHLDDGDHVHAIVEAAFGSPVEALLVQDIRSSENFVPDLSVVAERDGTVVGHVMLSYVTLRDGPHDRRVLSLSPLSVAPAAQKQGVGAALVREVLARAEARNEPLVCLEGDPGYYGRLGFVDSRDHGITFDLPDWAPPNAGQVFLLPAHRDDVRGKVVYPPAFARAEERGRALEAERARSASVAERPD